jgi:hypothetical protein
MLWTMANYDKGPIAIRYPRGNGPGVTPKDKPQLLEIGKPKSSLMAAMWPSSPSATCSPWPRQPKRSSKPKASPSPSSIRAGSSRSTAPASSRDRQEGEGRLHLRRPRPHERLRLRRHRALSDAGISTPSSASAGPMSSSSTAPLVVCAKSTDSPWKTQWTRSSPSLLSASGSFQLNRRFSFASRGMTAGRYGQAKERRKRIFQHSSLAKFFTKKARRV